jgi:hypothetical protein
MRKALTLVICTLVFGCADIRSLKYWRYPSNPYPGIKTVVVPPFMNHTEFPLDGERLANVFASELIKFEGFDVIRPARVRATLARYKFSISTVEDVIRLAKLLKADAIFTCTVTDYDPYYPPKMAISLQLFRVREIRLSAHEIDRIIKSATWRPFKITPAEAPYLVASLERIYDTHKTNTRLEVQAYAKVQQEDYAFRDGEQFLRISDRFWQFVSARIIFELISITPTKG